MKIFEFMILFRNISAWFFLITGAFYGLLTYYMELFCEEERSSFMNKLINALYKITPFYFVSIALNVLFVLFVSLLRFFYIE